MEKVIIYSVIAALVSVAVPFFIRRINSLSVFVVIAGLFIAYWANSNTSVNPASYERHDVHIEHAFFDVEEERLVILADGKKLLLSIQGLSKVDLSFIKEAAPRLAGSATIWLQPDSYLLAGINSPNLSIDPVAFAARTSSLYSRIRNVGFVISAFGLLMIVFNFFTRSVDVDAWLTQKY